MKDKILKPARYSDADQCAAAIIDSVGNRIVLGLPLGIGKPNHLVNALFQRAHADNRLQLTIITALSLRVPQGSSLPQQRFLEPINRRLYSDYPQLKYLKALHTGHLPPNVRIIEFYVRPGDYLHIPQAQRNILSSNYTHAVRDLITQGVNVVIQSVAETAIDDHTFYSLACNPDITLDLLPAMRAQNKTGKTLMIGQVNKRLPFMGASARMPPEAFDAILANDDYNHEPFSTINMPVDTVEHMIGLYASCLVRDGGTLQIGIGEIGDAIAHSLYLRHTDNAAYRRLLNGISAFEKFGDVIAATGDKDIFLQGLYGLTEMLSDGLLFLYRHGIIKRKVCCAGEKPENGTAIHAGFCLGSQAFYRALRELDATASNDIKMCPVSFTNELYGDDYLTKRAQRCHARFINSGLKATLNGAMASDGLENGQVISGVGGQYNFVAMAHTLPDARSILTVRSTRGQGGEVESNIVWNYGHITIPRHLRDIVVSEYGIADLRGKTDEEVIIEMLKIADSRFQGKLLKQAKQAGKLRKDYEIPPVYCNNYPDAVEQILQRAQRGNNICPEYPLGTDFTATEQALLHALEGLKALRKNKWLLIKTIAQAAMLRNIPNELNPYLQRMHLQDPRTLKEFFWKKILALQLMRQKSLRTKQT